MNLKQAYSNAGQFRQFLVAARPYICPFDPLTDHVPEGSTVLDVGCGAGAFLITLALQGKISSGVGCDLNDNAIHDARMAARNASISSLVFQRASSPKEIPNETFDVVSLIDVMHHVDPAVQRDFFIQCLGRVKPGGFFIYKDMANRPIWKNLFNRLHDLVLARQHIHYVPKSVAKSWALTEGFSMAVELAYSRIAYAHELLVFRRQA